MSEVDAVIATDPEYVEKLKQERKANRINIWFLRILLTSIALLYVGAITAIHIFIYKIDRQLDHGITTTGNVTSINRKFREVEYKFEHSGKWYNGDSPLPSKLLNTFQKDEEIQVVFLEENPRINRAAKSKTAMKPPKQVYYLPLFIPLYFIPIYFILWKKRGLAASRIATFVL